MDRSVHRLALRAGLLTTRLHDLRHTSATMLLLAGIDPVTAAGVLGHDPTMLLRTYGHVIEDAKRDAVDRLGERLELIVGRRS
jgi:integrase